MTVKEYLILSSVVNFLLFLWTCYVTKYLWAYTKYGLGDSVNIDADGKRRLLEQNTYNLTEEAKAKKGKVRQ